jgi:hypothetical protein
MKSKNLILNTLIGLNKSTVLRSNNSRKKFTHVYKNIRVLTSATTPLLLNSKSQLLNANDELATPLYHIESISTSNVINSNRDNLVIERYNSYVNSKQIRFDEHQYEAVLKINRFYNQVLHIDPDRFEANANSKSLNALFRNIFQLINKENGNSKERLDKIKSIKSIYLYGGVGNLTLFQ